MIDNFAAIFMYLITEPIFWIAVVVGSIIQGTLKWLLKL